MKALAANTLVAVLPTQEYPVVSDVTNTLWRWLTIGGLPFSRQIIWRALALAKLNWLAEWLGVAGLSPY